MFENENNLWLLLHMCEFSFSHSTRVKFYQQSFKSLLKNIYVFEGRKTLWYDKMLLNFKLVFSFKKRKLTEKKSWDVSTWKTSRVDIPLNKFLSSNWAPPIYFYTSSLLVACRNIFFIFSSMVHIYVLISIFGGFRELFCDVKFLLNV